MNVVLCGMMACGKSTVGKVLARRLGWKYVDTDEGIVQRYGAISALFETRGEAYFRRLEQEIVAEVAREEKVVIATGGGVVTVPENVVALRGNGRIVFLRAKLETLIERLRGDETRPLVQGEDWQKKTERILALRTPIYLAAADCVLDVDGKTAEEIVDEIIGNEKINLTGAGL